MNEEQKLEFTRTYDLRMEDEEFGEVLFVGRTKRRNNKNLDPPPKPWYSFAGMSPNGMCILSFSGDEFSLKDGKIVTSTKRGRYIYLSDSEREHIEEKLERFGNMKLEAIHVYDLDFDGRDFGKCLYLGERRGKNLTYRHQIVRRTEGHIFSTVFESYKLRGNTLKPINRRSHPLSPAEEKHLEGILDKAGL